MGVGTIIGTTTSLLIGGPGSIVWMFIFTLLTSSLIYLESFLGSTYKQKLGDSYVGGSYYYTLYGLKNKPLSIIILFLFIITYSCFFLMIQTNTIKEILNINPYLLSIIIFLLLTLLLNNKNNEITKILNKIVPIMCIFFLLISTFVVIKNFKIIPKIIKVVITSALNKKSFLTGMLIGIKRSIFLNELLIGTTSLSSGINNMDKEITAGTLTLGTYFITFIISSLVSLLVLIFIYYNGVLTTNYNDLLIHVFTFHFNNFGKYFLSLLICLLSITTILSGIYIGISSFSYIFKNKKLINIIKILLILIILSGLFIDTNKLWNLTDNIMLVLIILNTIIVTIRTKMIYK